MTDTDIAFEINQIPETFTLFKDVIKQMLDVDKDKRCTLDCVIKSLINVQD